MDGFYLRRFAYQLPPDSRSAVAQNTGSMPSAVPRAPNASGIVIWLMLTSVMRTPTASPTRPGGAVLWRMDMTMGCDMPSPSPRKKATPMSNAARPNNGNRRNDPAAIASDAASSGQGVRRREMAGSSPRMTKVATENAPSTRPMLEADRSMLEP